jgi:superfamily I DNA and/or RNA helicase
MVNEVEALLTRIFGESIPPETEVGVVTPHNAQRGRVSALFDDHLLSADAETGDNENREEDPARTQLTTAPTVETGERFQGDQRERMVLSGTVSDPEFIAQEARFLLNLNRINVALSRHINGVVVIAARSLFRHIPTDIEEYDEALLWPGLAAATGVVDHRVEPVVETNLDDLVMAADIDEEDMGELSVVPEEVTISGYLL